MNAQQRDVYRLCSQSHEAMMQEQDDYGCAYREGWGGVMPPPPKTRLLYAAWRAGDAARFAHANRRAGTLAEKRTMIFAAIDYNSEARTLASCNRVYMGGTAMAQLMRVFGLEYGDSGLSHAIEHADEKTLDRALVVCEPYLRDIARAATANKQAPKGENATMDGISDYHAHNLERRLANAMAVGALSQGARDAIVALTHAKDAGAAVRTMLIDDAIAWLQRALDTADAV